MSVTYTHTIRFTGWDGHTTTLSVSDPDADVARREVELWARAHGWTPRRWWQFWRWGE